MSKPRCEGVSSEDRQCTREENHPGLCSFGEVSEDPTLTTLRCKGNGGDATMQCTLAAGHEFDGSECILRDIRETAPTRREGYCLKTGNGERCDSEEGHTGPCTWWKSPTYEATRERLRTNLALEVYKLISKHDAHEATAPDTIESIRILVNTDIQKQLAEKEGK